MTFRTKVLSAAILVVVIAGCEASPGGGAKGHSAATDPAILSCGSEVIAAFREARNTTADGCDWTAIDTLDKARSVQQVAVAALSGNEAPAGYKLTTVPDGKIVGVYLDGMLMPSGSQVRRSQAARMFPEADLLFRVSDAAINDVDSFEAALAYIDAVVPFLELSGPITWPGAGRKAIPWTATNVSARFGAMGTPIEINLKDEAARAALNDIQVTLTKPDGSVHASVVLEESLLSNLPAMLAELRSRGNKLQAGDYLSLGNFGRPVTKNVAAGAYSVTYQGLTPEPVRVSLEITEP